MSIHLCVNCRFHDYQLTAQQGEVASEGHICTHPDNVDPVTGARDTQQCSTMRSSGRCTPSGYLWQPKEVAVPEPPQPIFETAQWGGGPELQQVARWPSAGG